MKYKLIKTTKGYSLLDSAEDVIATTQDKPNEVIKYQLSLKNCEAIENGYDLDQLGMDYASTIYDGRTESIRFNGAHIDFMKGFQKALEILGDKKFSEGDMLECWNTAAQTISISWVNFMESIEPNEWDVEIVTRPYTEVGEGFVLKEKREPKLDDNGCLILKR